MRTKENKREREKEREKERERTKKHYAKQNKVHHLKRRRKAWKSTFGDFSSSLLPSKVERRSQWKRRRRRRRRRKGERSAPSWKRVEMKSAAIFLPSWAGSDNTRAKAIEKTSGSYCKVNIKRTHKQRTIKRYQNTNR